MGNNPSKCKGAKNPVDSVSWIDCQDMLAKLKRKVPGQTFRLPTEAEWEYACRAGSTGEYCYGDSQSELGDYEKSLQAHMMPNSSQEPLPVRASRWARPAAAPEIRPPLPRLA